MPSRLLSPHLLIPCSIITLSWADGPEESYASVDLPTAPTPSIADNTKAAPVIDDLVRNSPLFAASFTNGSITRATHPEGGLEPFEDPWETKVKG